MKVRIVNRPYFDNSAVHDPGATVDIAGAAQFSAVCMVPADKAAEQELVAAGRWPLDEAGNGPKSRGAAAGGVAASGSVSLVEVAKSEASRIVSEAQSEASDILAKAGRDFDAHLAKANTEAGEIVASARLEAERIVADAKKATETKTDKPKS